MSLSPHKELEGIWLTIKCLDGAHMHICLANQQRPNLVADLKDAIYNVLPPVNDPSGP